VHFFQQNVSHSSPCFFFFSPVLDSLFFFPISGAFFGLVKLFVLSFEKFLFSLYFRRFFPPHRAIYDIRRIWFPLFILFVLVPFPLAILPKLFGHLSALRGSVAAWLLVFSFYLSYFISLPLDPQFRPAGFPKSPFIG